jgi:hypothetical protein
MKKINLIAAIMIIISSNIALATTVYTDYEGSGDFEIQTTIISPITPIITDSADINTGCSGGCCCCPDCAGDYKGSQIITNNPFSATAHNVNVTEGCVVIYQRYNDYVNGQSIATDYYTYFNGTGTAKSYIYTIPGQGMSYQLSNGTGSAFVWFTQNVFFDNVFDYGTSYGGGVMLCQPGYAGLRNQYQYSNGEIYYNSELGMYCYPVSYESSLYTFLFSKVTDLFSLNSFTEIGNVGYNQDIGVNGSAEYGTVINSKDDEIYFGFDMELG